MPVPGFYADIAADVVMNLRAALDQAGYGLAVASGKVKPKHTAFPFSGSADELKNSIAGRSKDIPSEICALFSQFQPYKGGNDLLATLNWMSNGEKHTTDLAAVGVVVGASSMYHTISDNGIRPTWDGTKNEITFVSVIGVGSESDYYFDLRLLVTFSEVQLMAGSPAVAVLDAIASEVHRVLMAVEAEGCRIGLIV